MAKIPAASFAQNRLRARNAAKSVSVLFLLLASVLAALGRSRSLPAEQQVRETIRRILARPEYHEPPVTFLQRVLEAIGRVVARILEWLLKPLEWLVDRIAKASPEMSPSTRWLVVGVLTFLLVALLLHIFYLLAGSFEAGRGRRRMGERDSQMPPNPADFVEHAKELARQGNYRDAVRALYIAALLRLDRAGIVSYDPARTNWEYLDALRGRPLMEPFREFTLIADRAMYSHAPIGAEDFARAEQLFSAVGVGEK